MYIDIFSNLLNALQRCPRCHARDWRPAHAKDSERESHIAIETERERKAYRGHPSELFWVQKTTTCCYRRCCSGLCCGCGTDCTSTYWRLLHLDLLAFHHPPAIGHLIGKHYISGEDWRHVCCSPCYLQTGVLDVYDRHTASTSQGEFYHQTSSVQTLQVIASGKQKCRTTNVRKHVVPLRCNFWIKNPRRNFM